MININKLNINLMKKIYYLLILLLMSFSSALYAQSTKSSVDQLSTYANTDTLAGWKHSGLAGIAFGQTSLSKWVAGGDKSTITGSFTLNATANYLKGKWFWNNNLLAEYGMIYATSTDWQKAADRLNINSIGGREISKKWSIAGLLNFSTQFSKGYNYPDKSNYISTLFAPAYLDAALGFAYKPNPKYTLFLSPIAERVTFVFDDSLSNAGAFGVDEGKNIKFETGVYLMGNTNQQITKDLGLISSVYLFTPYNERFGNFDVVWDLLLNYKLNKYFTASLNTTLRYYEAEIKALQFKEIFGLGLTYTF
jgi:hypothetical protein